MKMRVWTLCPSCEVPFDQLSRHWRQSRQCRPAAGQEGKLLEEARKRAYALTRRAAVVRPSELAACRGQEDPLLALCRHLGVVVAKADQVRQITLLVQSVSQ